MKTPMGKPRREAMRSQCYWHRILYRQTWSLIAKQFGVSAGDAKLHAEAYADQYNYPVPLVRARSLQQDVYMSKQNGYTWQQVARIHGMPIAKAKRLAKSFASLKGYRWPPFSRCRSG